MILPDLPEIIGAISFLCHPEHKNPVCIGYSFKKSFIIELYLGGLL